MKVSWNVLLLKDVWQAELRTANLLVPESSAVEFQAAIEKLNRCKSSSLITFRQNCFEQDGGKSVLSCTDLLILFGIR
jgi:hypothetical protein